MRQIDSLRRSPKFDSVLARAAEHVKRAVDAPPDTGAGADGDPVGVETPPSLRRAARVPRAIVVTDALDGIGDFPLPPSADAAMVEEAAQRIAEGAAPSQATEDLQFAVEAIILDQMRPAWFIVNDSILVEGDFDEPQLVSDKLALFNDRALPVGRIDLMHHATHAFVGTGWLIDKDIVVTNRHVAEAFAAADEYGALNFRRGRGEQLIEAMLNCIAQRDTDGLRRRSFAEEVLFIAGPRQPDIAFLRVQPIDGLAPLPLSAEDARDGEPVAAIGYPARDGTRNDPAVMGQVFGNIYDVKRFAPGYVTGLRPREMIFTTDYSTLGGNSGSAVVSLTTGEVVGLHFAGIYREANYAVPVDLVKAALRTVTPAVHAGGTPDITEAPSDPVTAPDALADRDGYDPAFLGPDRVVELPDVGAWADSLAPVEGAPDSELRYRHFSVLQCAPRRLPLLTAVNIDGAQARLLKRRGRWALDGRVAPDHQIGNTLYRDNRLDRGHMVRRRDPGWGAAAEEGEADTFHYTNAVPQHEALNQKDWVGLEDYLLGAAEMRGFRLSVFTGPVLREDDRRLKIQPGAEDVQIPEEFWKVAVMIDDADGELHATGYVLSQGRMIRRMTEAAFVLGAYKTFQLPIVEIERETGLRFDGLAAADPLNPGAGERAPRLAVPIEGPQDLVLRRPAASA